MGHAVHLPLLTAGKLSVRDRLASSYQLAVCIGVLESAGAHSSTALAAVSGVWHCDDVVGFAHRHQLGLAWKIYIATEWAGKLLGFPMSSAKSRPPSHYPQILGVEFDMLADLARPKPSKLRAILDAIEGVIRQGWKMPFGLLETLLGQFVYYSQMDRRGSPSQRTLRIVLKVRAGEGHTKHTKVRWALDHEARADLTEWACYLSDGIRLATPQGRTIVEGFVDASGDTKPPQIPWTTGFGGYWLTSKKWFAVEHSKHTRAWHNNEQEMFGIAMMILHATTHHPGSLIVVHTDNQMVWCTESPRGVSVGNSLCCA